MERLAIKLRRAAAFGALACAMATAAVAQPPEEEEMSEEERTEEAGEEDAAPLPPAGAPLLPDRPLMLRTGASYSRDTNLFRSPNAAADNIGTAYVGLSLDKAYAQQRFRLDITETAYRYENFSHLDFEGLNYLGAWTWQLGPRIGGALRATRAESLADYSEFRNPGQQNVRTTEDFALSADAWLFGGWHLTGALSRVKNRYSVPFPQEGSYEADGREAGVRWVARVGELARVQPALARRALPPTARSTRSRSSMTASCAARPRRSPSGASPASRPSKAASRTSTTPRTTSSNAIFPASRQGWRFSGRPP